MKALLKKKSVLIAALAVLLIGTGVAATLAYLTDKEDALVNTFKVGDVTTEIEEPFEPIPGSNTEFKKEPSVKNIGENDCYVRARVLASPEEALLLKEFSNNWTYKEDDGFYYYNDVLPAGGQTDAIFKKVEVTDTSIDGFEVTVYQEAVQTIVYRENGEPLVDSNPQDDDRSAMYAIWKWYDNGGKESSSDSNNS